MASGTVIGSLRVALGLDSAQFQRGAAQAQGSMRNFERSAQRMVSALAAVGVALGAVVSLRKFVDATAESERAQAQLAAVLQSTGSAAGRTIEQLNRNAAALQRMTTFGDEAVNAMQGVLLTFTQINGEQFDEATEAVLNLSTAMGTSLNAAALQVGKALNDPVGGINSLTRAGIQFTDAQKATIRSLVELGDVAGAQTVILAELERQFGGSAEAARETLGGALKALENAWGDLFEIGGPAADNLRLSIEELIATVSDPAFVAAFQAIGSGMFNALNTALQAVQGLQMALQDVSFLLGFANTTSLMDDALRRASEALNTAVASSASLTRELPRGVAISKDMAQAKLDEAEAYLAAARAASVQAAQTVAQSNDYLAIASRANDLRREIDDLVSALENLQSAGDNPGSMVNVSAMSGEIIRLRLELIAAENEAAAMLETAAALGPKYVEQLVEIERIRGALAEATGETVILDNATDAAAAAGVALGQTLGGLSMSSQPSAQAALLAQQLGIALDVATRLNATLNQQAGTGTAETPRLGFGLGSTLNDPLANGLANTVLGFGNVTQAADETWRSVTDLTTATNALAEATGGGGAAGTAGELADALSIVVDEGERAKRALEGGPTGEAKSGGGFLGDMTTEVEALGNAFEDFIESGMTDFRGFTDDLVRTFSRAVSEMVAEAAAAQLGQSLGMFAGPIGGIVGSIAGSLLGGLFGGGKTTRYEDTAQYDIDQERMELTARNLDLLGREDLLRKRQLQSYDKSNRALAREVMLLEDAIAVEAEAARIQQQIWQLTGDTTAIREAELAALDPANRALQERVFQLQDEAEAAAEAARVQSERMSLEEQRLALLGREDLLRQMQLDSIDESNQALQEEIWALEDAAAAAEEAARVDDERLALEKELLTLQGDTAELRALELEALDATNRALQEEIWALEDAQAVANERLTLEKQLLQAQGDTAALRHLELEALDASNRAIQEQIFALEDQAKAAQEASQIGDERLRLEKDLLTLQGDTEALRQLDLEALDESNRALQLQIWALEDFKDALNDIVPEDFTSIVDYNRALALAGQSAANVNAPSTVTPYAGSVTQASDPLVSEIRALRDLMFRVEQHTKRSNTTLTAWDQVGIPPERAA